MDPELAERLLRTVMKDVAEEADFANQLGILRSLANYKYDDYQQYAPGRQFIASLGLWLDQFDSPSERRDALRYVQERLIYISDAEMRHLVTLMAHDRVPSVLQREVCRQLDLPIYRVAAARAKEEFTQALKASLFLGMSDGARIDQFRRSNPGLSNEQIAMTYEINPSRTNTMINELKERVDEESAAFKYIFLVDDFAGSGKTILRGDEEDLDGRLYRFVRDTLPSLSEGNCPKIFIALYVVTQQAAEHLETLISSYPSPPWSRDNVPEVISVMTIGDHARLSHDHKGREYKTDQLFDCLLHKYYDKSVEDEHKGTVKHGFSECGLPLVLSHNTPNNSVYLIWEQKKTTPLFPRYDRHQSRLEGE